MRIALVVPGRGRRVNSGLGRLFRPLVLRHQTIGPLLIAAALENQQHQVQVIDAEAEELGDRSLVRAIASFGPDLIGVYANLILIRHVLRTVHSLKQAFPEVPLIAGGPCVTSIPEALLAHSSFDYGVIGEGEATIVELTNAIEGRSDLESVRGIVFKREGQIVRTPDRPNEANLDSLPMPAWRHVRFELYRDIIVGNRRFANVLLNRGCPYHCLFCDPKSKLGQRPRFRSIDSIVEELAYLRSRFGVENVYFNDDTFTLNREQILGFCERLLSDGLDISWECRTRVDLVDYELLSMMRRAGCEMIGFGVESGDNGVLRSLRKGITIEQTQDAFEACKRAGVDTLAYFMVGGPVETRETARRTVKFASRIEPTYIVPAQCRVFPPGTDLVRIAVERGLIFADHWEQRVWRDPGCVAPCFVTGEMSRPLAVLYLARLHALNMLWPARNLRSMLRGHVASNFKSRLLVGLQVILLAVDRKRLLT
ncbi:MAG: radical SAM protein [Candidatus Coatesbacteria bacterium]|nr:radical SAM protein [Candidatus Coatesbacteria bacterium]